MGWNAVCVAFGVLIVDDDRLFLEAAHDLLEREGLRVVGVAATAAEALRRAEELRPEVVLVDIMLGGGRAGSTWPGAWPNTTGEAGQR